MTVRITVADLGPLTRLDSGGQGVVFAAPRLRMQYASSLVFKQYKPNVAESLDVSVLESMPTYLESLAFAAAGSCCPNRHGRAAWSMMGPGS